MPRWVTVEKLSDLVGLSREAIWALKKKGYLCEGIHWVKKGRRLFFNLEKFYEWLEGTQA